MLNPEIKKLKRLSVCREAEIVTAFRTLGEEMDKWTDGKMIVLVNLNLNPMA
jgi:hypothetical protein